MTTIIMREKSHELKKMLEKAMEIAECLCEGEMGERNYGNRMNDPMGMREYPEYPDEYGDRRMSRGSGRYSRY